VPAIANASNTTLPVMFAVNTLPRARKLTASARPVTAVRPRRTRAKIGAVGDGACMTRSVTRRCYPGSRVGIPRSLSNG